MDKKNDSAGAGMTLDGPDLRRILHYMLCAQYTQRLQGIISQVPTDVLFGKATQLPTDRTGTLIAYIDLCAEQYFLNHQGMVPTEVWKEWEGGMVRFFNLPAVQAAWQDHREQLGYVDFMAHMHRLVPSLAAKAPPASEPPTGKKSKLKSREYPPE